MEGEWGMAVIDSNDIVPMAEAGKRLPALVREVQHSAGQKVFFKNNHPVAVLVGVDRLEVLQEAEDSLEDLALVMARQLTDRGGRKSLDSILTALGTSREELKDEAS
jgi:PHD/YefM family antitoxin component YafN of YafNO toxin-antitoxin module